MLNILKKLYDKCFSFHGTDPGRFEEVPRLIMKSRTVALTFQNESISVDHFLIAMMEDEIDTRAKEYLTTMENAEAIRHYLIDVAKKQATDLDHDLLSFSEDANKALKSLEKTAQNQKTEHIRAEHILLALIKEKQYPFKELNYQRVAEYLKK